jgi:hypothetical protein
MNREYNTYAYYWVQGFECDHSEITGILNLEPTTIEVKGEPNKHIPNRNIKENLWQFHSSLPRTEIFQDAHLVKLLESLLSRKAEILALSKKYECGINCVGYYTNVHPGFHLSSKLLRDSAELELDIDFDLYNY